MNRLVKMAIMAVALLAFAPLASAVAAPMWEVKARWGDTVVAPGDTVQFSLQVHNIGDSASNGSITVKDQLPSGVKIDGFEALNAPWSCLGVGTSTATCQMVESIPAAEPQPSNGSYSHIIFINATCVISAGCTEGDRQNVALVSSPGAVKADGTACGTGFPPIPCATDVDNVRFSSEPTPFGLVPETFLGGVFQEEAPDQTAELQAGTHPGELRTDFDLNLEHGVSAFDQTTFQFPVGRVRTVVADLPRGLYGNPEATPKCKPFQFLTEGSTGFIPGNTTGCPANTQIGYLTVEFNVDESQAGYEGLGEGPFDRIAIYNLEPPKGVPADFGFHAGGLVDQHIYPSLDPARGYAITATSPNVNDILAVRGVKAVFWGVPGDPSHDRFRAYPELQPGDIAYGASAGTPVMPFLSMPADCGAENGSFRLSVDDWRNPGAFTPPVEGNSLDVSGCDDPRFRFEPKVQLQPTNRAAGGPTGLDVHLEVPQREQRVDDFEKLYARNGNVHGIDTPPLKKVVVTLPEGMTLSTSAAQGLGNCSLQQIGISPDGTPNGDPVSCPENSRFGTLTLHTTILPKDEPMRGDIYIAKQSENPFNNFLSMYLVIEDPSRGLRVKLPGRVDLDPNTGQITTTFDNLPQYPISDTQLTFKSGVRAALVNPSTCGEKTIKAEFFSWSEPTTPVTRTSSYDVTENPDGSPCVQHLGERPFEPQLEAGTVSNSAGTYSPFVFRLTRKDEDQEFSQLQTTLPPGLTAKIAGISRCSDAAIAQATYRTGAGQGELEQIDPSCPASSEIGSSQVGSGVGQALTYIPGKVYLAGPYRGAPLSMVVITPVVTGPYDLGVNVVRAALDLDRQTAQVSVTTDPFPQIYQGIPVRLRDIRVSVDRPETTLNPTSCDPMAIAARVTGTGGDLGSTADDSAVDLSERFQAANCDRLGFKPKLTFRFKGSTTRTGHPALTAVLRPRAGDANIGATSVILPHSTFLDQSHIVTVCTRVQFAARTCPEGSIYGHARAISPLLDQPLEGPVYLRSNGGERLLPDLVADLRGEISIELVGHIDAVHARIRNTFEAVPDAPVTGFVLAMRGGKKGLIQNSANLCSRAQRVKVQMTGQNGKAHDFASKLQVKCGKSKNRNKGRHRGHGKRAAK